MSQIVRSITATFEDDGLSVRSIRGQIDEVIRDGQGNVQNVIHAGTKTAFNEQQLSAAFPQAALLAQINALQTEREGLATDRDALKDARDALVVERDALRAQLASSAPQAGATAVTALQGRLAINTVPGLRNQVEAAVAAGDQNTKDFWEFSTVWHRDNALLNALAIQVCLSTQQMDGLFALARTL